MKFKINTLDIKIEIHLTTLSKKDIPGAPEYSHVVPHRTTDLALQCLTAQIGRDAVSSLWYGPR
jgi:hypothetical protein